MAETIAQAISDKEHAIIEAPTGVGKSFAYLVPAIQHALQSGPKSSSRLGQLRYRNN